MKSKMVIFAGLVLCTVAGACGTGSDTSSQERSELPKLSQASVTDVTWYDSWDEGMAAAEKAGKPVLVHFTAEWCVYCRKMKIRDIIHLRNQEALNEGWITIMIDTDDKVRRGMSMLKTAPRKRWHGKNGTNDSFKAENITGTGSFAVLRRHGTSHPSFHRQNGAPLNKDIELSAASGPGCHT